MLTGMLDALTGRGPDSAGFAIYGQGTPGVTKLTLRGPMGTDWEALARDAQATVQNSGDHAVLSVAEAALPKARAVVARAAPGVRIASEGSAIELFKGVGQPLDVARRFGLPNRGGTHAIGHTRLATESAVTISGAHPFSTGVDQCLVHNGSLSNHNGLRRSLARDGLAFETENDTEVAASYLTHRLALGEGLESALTAALDDLDGFYTFVVGTETGFGVLRDRVACKPAVMAETDQYVAFGSEYRALADLPGIEAARVFEPQPARPYIWELT